MLYNLTSFTDLQWKVSAQLNLSIVVKIGSQIYLYWLGIRFGAPTFPVYVSETIPTRKDSNGTKQAFLVPIIWNGSSLNDRY